MNNYQDKYGRFHHKPVTDGEPSSNNGWIYTAYAQKVGVPVDMEQLKVCFRYCSVVSTYQSPAHIIRSPGNPLPVISRDEILGMTSLGFLKPEHLQSWNFSPYTLPKFSFTKLLSQLWQLRPTFSYSVTINTDTNSSSQSFLEWKHRNYFWQNGLDQIYRFAFSVPVQDRYFILKKWDSFKWYKPSHILYLTIAKIDAKLSPSGLRFLKYTPYPFKTFADGESIKAMISEFPTDHPIRVKLGI